MTFGNGENVRLLTNSMPQTRDLRDAHFARDSARRDQTTDVALGRRDPPLQSRAGQEGSGAAPRSICRATRSELGRDVAFWHRAPSEAFTSALNDFVRLDATVEEWEDPAFERVLRDFQRRFAATNTEEGSVMATVLAYATQEAYTSGRSAILHEFRTSSQIRELFDLAVSEREAVRLAQSGR